MIVLCRLYRLELICCKAFKWCQNKQNLHLSCAPQALLRSNFFSLNSYCTLLDLLSGSSHSYSFPPLWTSSIEGALTLWLVSCFTYSFLFLFPFPYLAVILMCLMCILFCSYNMFTTLWVCLIYISCIVL